MKAGTLEIILYFITAVFFATLIGVFIDQSVHLYRCNEVQPQKPWEVIGYIRRSYPPGRSATKIIDRDGVTFVRFKGHWHIENQEVKKNEKQK